MPEGSTSLKTWSCQLQVLPGDKAESTRSKKETAPTSEEVVANKFTVGEKRQLICDGDFVENFQPPYHFIMSEAKDTYILYPLEEISHDGTHLHMRVTGYKPGTFTDYSFTIASVSGAMVKTSPLQWTIESVIKNPQQKPYGRTSFMRVPWPQSLWVDGGVILALVLTYVGFRVVRRQIKKRLLRRLDKLKTHLSPYHQWNKDIRALKKKIFRDRKVMEADREFLKISFLNYISLKLSIDAHGSDIKSLEGRILKTFDIKAEKHRRLIQSVKKALNEIDVLVQRNYDEKDFYKVVGLMQDTTDNLERRLS